jgi:hypothetical protein
VTVELGGHWYVGPTVDISRISDSTWAEVVSIRRVVVRTRGELAVLRFTMRDTQYDFCSLRDEECRDHRDHLRSATTYNVWQVCAVVDGLPACSGALDARP